MLKPPYKFLQTTDGVRLRYNLWRCNADHRRGTFLILGGRTEFMEKYQETIQEITGRGFNAFSFDWRGQGGSQRLLKNATKGYVQSYDHYVSDLKQMLEEAVASECPKPIYILAHSMGAHIAMHYLGRYAHDIKAVVLSAPMVNINTAPLPPSVLRILSQWMVCIGQHGVMLPGQHPHDALYESFEHNRLTSDRVRFQRVQQMLLEKPDLAVGGVTFGWLTATFNAIDKLHAAGFIQNVDLPVLLVLAGCEQVVSNAATQHLAEKLPKKEIAFIKGARHEILQERDTFRLQFWRAFDRFMA